jgi:hypothetical protein
LKWDIDRCALNTEPGAANFFERPGSGFHGRFFCAADKILRQKNIPEKRLRKFVFF